MCNPFSTSTIHSSSECLPRAVSGRQSSISPQTVAQSSLRLHHHESRWNWGLVGALQGDLPLWSSIPSRLLVSIILNGCSWCQPPPPPTHPPSAFPPFPAQWLELARALAPTHPLINAQVEEGETFKEIPPTALTEKRVRPKALTDQSEQLPDPSPLHPLP